MDQTDPSGCDSHAKIAYATAPKTDVSMSRALRVISPHLGCSSPIRVSYVVTSCILTKLL